MCDNPNCHEQRCEIPFGECHCGCKGTPKPVGQTKRSRGVTKGFPCKFLAGHTRKGFDPLTNVQKTDNGCWVWQGSINQYGYGRVSIPGGNYKMAHRFFYESLIGPIPQGLELDHLCRTKACCNPTHLEPVTHTENVRRGNVPKLDKNAADEIRASEDATKDLAERFGVSERLIRQVRQGLYWK